MLKESYKATESNKDKSVNIISSAKEDRKKLIKDIEANIVADESDEKSSIGGKISAEKKAENHREYSYEEIKNGLKDGSLLEWDEIDELISSKNENFMDLINFEDYLNVDIKTKKQFENYKKIFKLKRKNFDITEILEELDKIYLESNGQISVSGEFSHPLIHTENKIITLWGAYYIVKEKDKNIVEYNFYKSSPYYGIKIFINSDLLELGTFRSGKKHEASIELQNGKKINGILLGQYNDLYFKINNGKKERLTDIIKRENNQKSEDFLRNVEQNQDNITQKPAEINKLESEVQNPEETQKESSKQADKHEQTKEQENISKAMKYSENVKKADNGEITDNWIINELKLIKQEKGINSLQNMSNEEIKTLLEEFKQGFKFKNMKNRNPKGIQVTLGVQAALGKLGYNTSIIDGFYGKGTRKAVAEFQKDNNLKADGISGSNTINKIIELLNKRPS